MGQREELVLGLDIGVASVGWALIRWVDGVPREIVGAGVRRFETGTDGKKAGEAGITQGRDESRAKARRIARSQRRQIDRRSQRVANTVRHLQSGGLLPPGTAGRGDSRHNFIHSLDIILLPLTLQRYLKREPSLDAETAAQIVATRFPYLLRAAALDEQLTPFELGRVFLHLAQRRGYQSNRKEASKMALAEQEQAEKRTAKKTPKADATEDADNPKKTLAAIKSLRADIASVGAPTLGAYLATLNPHEHRIRTLRTHRDMFVGTSKEFKEFRAWMAQWPSEFNKDQFTGEFERIVAAQAPFHPILRNDDFLRRLHHALFFQRPLRSARALRNRCELMPPRRCVAKASLVFQRYRMITEVNNNLGEVIEKTGELRPTSEIERKKLYQVLSETRSLTLPAAREAAELPKGAKWKVELSEDYAKGKRLPGESLAIALTKAAPEWWSGADPTNREALVTAMRGAENDDTLIELLQSSAWNFDAATADAIAKIPLEEGYGAYSRGAIEKLLPHLEKGWTGAASIAEEFKQTKVLDPLDLLPPIKGKDRAPGEKKAQFVDPQALGDVRNPAVMRSLTELRKVVNHIIRKYRKKPDVIRVELARDLKRGREERKAIYRNNQKRETTNLEIEHEVREKVSSFGSGPISRRDRVKWSLALECDFQCPYTGTVFTPHDVLTNGRAEVEHIIPRSKYGDDSFNNLTLCLNTENANKNGRTPWEAYGIPDPQRYKEILQRVSRFKGPAAGAKLEAFQRQDTTDEAFAMRHLNDTRYISRLAVRYLGFLYGCVDDPTLSRAIDAQRRWRVQSSTGGLTSLLRKKWHLMQVMDKLMRAHPGSPHYPADLTTEQKNELNKRVDHRHHAMDAIVVALTTPALIEQLANVARDAELKRLPPEKLPPIPDPWAGFIEDVENSLNKIIVSQRPDYRVNGQLHDAQPFSRPITTKNQKQRTHQRVFIENVDPAKIADDALRAAVEKKLGDLAPDKAFDRNRPETLPVFGTGTGAHPVRRVRVVKFDKAGHLQQIGAGFVQEGSNNHLVIFERLDPATKPRDKFGWETCSTLTAVRRVRDKQPLVQVPAGCEARWVLRIGDCFELTDEKGATRLYILDSISDGDIQFRMPFLTKPKDNKMRKFQFGHPRITSVKAWLEAKPKQMRISVLGEVSEMTGAKANV
jgi:CRISPR-associated endonuclease Csn1